MWELPASGVSFVRRRLLRGVRLAVLVWRQFVKDRCQFLAFALTYITLLSIVPLIAFAFAVATGLQAEDHLRPLVEEQLGPNLRDVSDRLFEAVKNTNYQALGWAGALFLLYTVIRGLATFEDTFNIIFNVRKSRSLVRKFTDYLSVLAVGPLLLAIAIALTGALQSSAFGQEVLGFTWARVLVRLAPFVLIWAVFTFVYIFLPNTKVRFGSALLGGILAGTAFQICQWGYFHFQVGITQYSTIYGVFATLPVFMVWIYIAWLIVLVGAEFTYVHQHEDALRMERFTSGASASERERQALRVIARISDQFVNGGEMYDADSLARSLGVHLHFVSDILERLMQTGFVAETTGAAHRFVLARDPDRTTAADVVTAIRCHGRDCPEGPLEDPHRKAIDRLLGKAKQAEESVLGRYTLRMLAEQKRALDERPGEPVHT